MDLQLLIQTWDASASLDSKLEFKKQLAHQINEMLLNDFEKLVQILYVLDVPEKKLKAELAANHDNDSGDLIADLIIKRQEEKLAARQAFPPANNIAEDEGW